MIATRPRRLEVAFLVAMIETVVILAACALVVIATGQTELLAAALSSSVGMSLVLAVQWHRLKHGAGTTFMPELMPAIVVALVATRAFSATLPDTMSGPAMLSLELACAMFVGGTMGFVLSLPAVRKVTTAVAETLM